MQGLSQDLETGCPELVIVKLLGWHPIFQGRPQYTQSKTINMCQYQFIEIRYNILMSWELYWGEIEQFYAQKWHFMKLITILFSSLGGGGGVVLRWGVIFEGLGVQMTPSWLRLWCILFTFKKADMQISKCQVAYYWWRDVTGARPTVNCHSLYLHQANSTIIHWPYLLRDKTTVWEYHLTTIVDQSW